jgi:hypothetical protein
VVVGFVIVVVIVVVGRKVLKLLVFDQAFTPFNKTPPPLTPEIAVSRYDLFTRELFTSVNAEEQVGKFTKEHEPVNCGLSIGALRPKAVFITVVVEYASKAAVLAFKP